MESSVPSRTAQGAAMHRAAHQLLDRPVIFEDPLALKIIGPESAEEIRQGVARQSKPESGGLRAFLSVRSRFTEDSFAAAYERGARQYVLLGAGLDTFAYRAVSRFAGVTVFEVDHPATQNWKRERLREVGIAIPGIVTYAPVDFERETLRDGLTRANFDFGRPAFFAWLGVVPYLSREAVMGTLSFVGQTMKSGSEIVFDYPTPADPSDKSSRFEEMAKRVAALGEPFRSAFEPAELKQDLAKAGYSLVEDMDSRALNALYFQGRSDGLSLRGRGHIMRAKV
jgi:methyltransferase (TIGR00027 family)